MNIKSKIIVFLFLFLQLFQNKIAAQKLKQGEKAINFEVIDTNGDTVKLENYQGQKIFLAFFRYASCPVCNYRFHELIENYDAITAKGYTIIAVYESSNKTLKDFLTETHVPFKVVGDPELKLYKKYGVEKSFWKMIGSVFQKEPMQAKKKGSKMFSKNQKRDGNITRIPADFLIDETGIITTAYYGENIGDHLPLIEILDK